MTFKTIENFRLVDGDKIENLPADTINELANKEDTENKGQPNGYAELGADGRVPVSQIPVGTGTGDMVKIVYDTDNSGVVDNSEALEGNDSAYHLDRENHTGTQLAETISNFDSAVENSPKVVEIDGKVDNNTSAISANTQAIANLATASGQFTDSGIQVVTTTETTIPFTVVSQSSDVSIFEFNDISDTISFKVDAPFNFSTNMSVYTATSQPRTLTIRGRKVSDDSLVYERNVNIEQPNNALVDFTTSTLLTLGQGGYPSSPFDLYFTAQADNTGLEIRNFSSILSSGTQYNIDVSTNWGDIGGTLSNQTDLQNALDAKAENAAELFYDNTIAGVLNATNTQDAIDEMLSKYNAAIVLKGNWDASVGTFPSGANSGFSYIVSVAGTVDGVEFNVNDRLIAIADNASTTTYTNNWIKADYTDQVLSVNGQTGAVIIDEGKVGTKTVDETNIGDGKILSYNQTSGNVEYVNLDVGGDSPFQNDGDSGASKIVDFSTSNNRILTINQNTEITVDNIPDGVMCKLNIKNGGNHTVTWSTGEQYINITSTYNIGAASYDGVNFNISSQLSVPRGITFKNDGTRMYLIGTSSDRVYQYSLSTPWDLTTCSYDSKSFYVNSQESNPNSINFNNNGTKMYVSGESSDSIHQYTLSTAWDISTASYDSVSFSLLAQDGNSTSTFFNNDGTKLYMSGFATTKLYQYTLSTAWDISTASYDNKSLNVNQYPTSGVFNADGTKLFMLSFTNQTIYRYGLSTAWDISTASYDGVSMLVGGQDTGPESIYFSNDGVKLFMVGFNTDRVYQYNTYTFKDIYWQGGTEPTLTSNSQDIVYFIYKGDDNQLLGKADLDFN